MMRILWHGPPLVGPPPPQPHNRPKTMTTTTTTSVGDRQRVSSRTRSAFKALTFALLPTKIGQKGYLTFCSRSSSSSSSSSAAAEKVYWFLKFSLLQRASRMRKCSWLCIPPRLLVLLLLLLLELHHFRSERASKTLLSTQMHTQEPKWIPNLQTNFGKLWSDVSHIQVQLFTFFSTPRIKPKTGTPLQQSVGGAGRTTNNSKPPTSSNHYDWPIRNTEQQSNRGDY